MLNFKGFVALSFTLAISICPALAVELSRSCQLTLASDLTAVRNNASVLLELNRKGDLFCWAPERQNQVNYWLERAPDEQQYRALRKELAYCRAALIIDDSELYEPIESTLTKALIAPNNALVHLVGDIFGKKSGFETAPGSLGYLKLRHIVIKKMKDIFDRYLFVPDSDFAPLCKEDDEGDGIVADPSPEFLEQLDAQLSTSIRLTSSFARSSFEGFYQDFKTTTDALTSTGESFFFTGGWPGHLVTYEVSRDAGDTYSFRIYNIGQGAEFNQTLWVNLRHVLYAPYSHYEQINKDKLLDKLFLFNLYKTNHAVREDNFADTLQASLRKYLAALPCMGRVKLENFVEPQRSGTCGYASLPLQQKSWAQARFSDEQDIRAKSDMVEQLINSIYVRFFMNRLSKVWPTQSEADNTTDLELLNSGIQYYMENLLRKQKTGIADAGVITRMVDDISHWQQQVEFSSPKAEQKPLAVERSDEWRIWRIGNKVNLDISPEQQAEIKQKIGRFYATIDDWSPKVSSPVAQLQTVVDIFREWDFNESMVYQAEYRRAIEAMIGVRRLVQKLPASCEGEHCLRDYYFSAGYSFDETNKLISLLADLSEEYFWAMMVAIKYHQYQISIEDLLTQVKIYTIADAVVNHYLQHADVPELKGMQFNLKIVWFDNYLFQPLNGISFFAKSKNSYQQFLLLRDYWQRPGRYNAGKILHLTRGDVRFYFHRNQTFPLPPLEQTDAQFKALTSQDEITFLTTYLDRVKNNKKYTVFPGDADDVDKMISLLSNEADYLEGVAKEERVPEFYYALSKLSILTYSFRYDIRFFSHPSYPRKLNKKNSVGRFVNTGYPWSYRNSVTVLNHRVFGDSLDNDLPIPNHHSLPAVIFDSKNSQFFDEQTPGGRFNRFRKYARWNTQSRIIQNQNNYVVTQSLNGRLTMEERRRGLHILGDTYSQTRQLLAFYKSQPYLLKDRDHQIYFEQAILDIRLFQHRIGWDEKTASVLTQFIVEQYNSYKYLDINLAAFFLRMSHLIGSLFESSFPDLAMSLPNVRNELLYHLESIEPGINSRIDTKRKLFILYLRTFIDGDDNWDSKKLGWYLIANVFLAEIKHLPSPTDLSHELDELVGINERYLVRTQAFLAQDSSALNAVASYFIDQPRNEDTVWIENYPSYISDDQSLNIFTFDYRYQEHRIGNLPNSIAQHPVFNKIIDWDKYNAVIKVGILTGVCMTNRDTNTRSINIGVA